jgi:hypothetical protein
MNVLTSEAVPRGAALPPNQPTKTHDFAAALFTQVADAYLEFRREHYHEEHPTLASAPPQHAEVRHNELAVLAENTLRLVTPAVKSLPVLGGLLEHLEEVVNIHTISEVERSDLHNLTVTFLYGVQGGIQPWFVEWYLTTARRLAEVSDEHYFMRFPWDACLYLDAQELSEFEAAVRRGNGRQIESYVQHLASQLQEALHDPVKAEADFAFTGPNAERQRTIFTLKTVAAMTLVLYVVLSGARTLLADHKPKAALQSVRAPLPAEIATHRVVS